MLVDNALVLLTKQYVLTFPDLGSIDSGKTGIIFQPA